MSPPLAAQRESFPELNLVNAKAAMERWPGAICVFQRQGRTIGQLFIRDVADNSITVNYIIAAKNFYTVKSEEIIRTSTPRTNIHTGRTFIKCPCGNPFWSLYFKGHWACRKCHGLHYRRQLIDKELTLWETRDKLYHLRNGRPKGMHNGTYVRLRQELLSLELRLRGKSRKYPSSTHDLIVTSRWLPATEVELWATDYTVRSGEIVTVESLL